MALMPALFLFILLRRPIWDVDIFWQLKLGELALANGQWIKQEPFAAHYLDEAVPSFAWLGQMLLAQLRLWWGWAGLRLFDASCWLGAMGVVAWACRRRGAPMAGLLIGLPIAFIVALPYASIRPQSLALLCFGLLLAVLRLHGPAWRRLGLAALLLPLWQNLHPSVAIAVLYLGGLAAAHWLDWLRRPASVLPWESTMFVALAGLALLATPEGLSIITDAAHNARESRAMLLAMVAFTAGPARFSDQIPVRQIQALHAQGVRGVVFAHFPWGGPVIDSSYPAVTVAYDGRYYRYTRSEWGRYRRLVKGEVGPEELERIYRPAAYVLSPAWTPGLIAALKADPMRWRLISQDSVAVIFVRRNPA